MVLLGKLDELALVHIVTEPKPLLAHARADLDNFPEEILPMVSYGPIVAAEEYCWWSRIGPPILLRDAADSLEWAHRFSQAMLPVVSYGPIVAAEEYYQWS